MSWCNKFLLSGENSFAFSEIGENGVCNKSGVCEADCENNKPQMLKKEKFQSKIKEGDADLAKRVVQRLLYPQRP
mgnify:CR=1 FL=1